MKWTVSAVPVLGLCEATVTATSVRGIRPDGKHVAKTMMMHYYGHNSGMGLINAASEAFIIH